VGPTPRKCRAREGRPAARPGSSTATMRMWIAYCRRDRRRGLAHRASQDRRRVRRLWRGRLPPHPRQTQGRQHR
jgi:hypothetical protein